MRRLPTALRGISSIVTGSVAGQGLVILAYPFLTRMYTPAQFGLLAVFASVVGIFSVVSTACLEDAIPIPPDKREATAVAWVGLAAVMVTSMLVAVVGVVAADPLANLLGVPQLADYWWLVALSVFVWGVYLILSEWMVRERSYGALARRNLLQGIGQVAVQVGLGLAGVKPAGLLLGMGAGRLAALGGLTSRGGLLRQPRPAVAALRAAGRRFRRFALLAAPSALVTKAGLELPLLLVAALYGDARAGLLGLTVRVISGPLAIVGQAVNQVFTGETGLAIRRSQGMLGASVRGNVLRLLAVGALPAVVLIVFGPSLFALVFGAEWTEAGRYAQILALSYLAQFAVIPVSSILALTERQGQQLGWSVLRLLLTAGGLAVCGVIEASVITAITVLGITQALSYVALYAFCVRAADVADGRRTSQP